MNDTLERLRKVAPLPDHREFTTVRLDLLQAARAEIESLELSWSNCSRACAKMQTERDAAQNILRRIVHTHMHNGHCTWCDSDAHERDCFVAAAIAETSRRSRSE